MGCSSKIKGGGELTHNLWPDTESEALARQWAATFVDLRTWETRHWSMSFNKDLQSSTIKPTLQKSIVELLIAEQRIWESVSISIFLAAMFFNQLRTSLIPRASARRGWCFKQVMKVAAALMWGLWQNRNSVIWKGTVQQPTRIVNYACNFLAQWKSANSDSNFSTASQHPSSSTWSKPAVGWFKCNVAASLFSKPG